MPTCRKEVMYYGGFSGRENERLHSYGKSSFKEQDTDSESQRPAVAHSCTTGRLGLHLERLIVHQSGEC